LSFFRCSHDSSIHYFHNNNGHITFLKQCGSSVAFYAVGYAFAFGDGSNPNGFIGTTNFFLMDVEDYTFWIFQYAFSAASATIVAGTLAERCKMGAYAYYTTIVSGFVYPVVVHVIWSNHGFLSPFKVKPFLGVGVIDFAGSGVVHITGGCVALIATWVLGPRRGRFHDEKTGELLAKPKDIKGHNMGLQVRNSSKQFFTCFSFLGDLPS
jgi:Amt family ammonium transporter